CVASGLLHRGEAGRIGASAADVAAHALADLGVAQLLALRLRLGDEPHRRADLSRLAVAALERVVLDERGLHCMKLARARKSLDRDDLVAFVREREAEAGVDAPAVHQHGARAAL